MTLKTPQNAVSGYTHLGHKQGRAKIALKPSPFASRSSLEPSTAEKIKRPLASRIADRIALFLSIKIRIIPVVIFCALMVLSVRINTLYTHLKSSPLIELSQVNATPQQAQKASTTTSNTQPAQKNQTIDSVTELDPLNMSPDQYKALQGLVHQEDKFAARVQELPEKEQVLKALIAKLDEKRQELDLAKKELEQIINKIDEQDNANVKRLVKIAETMKPAEAAQILEGVDFPILLEIMEMMQERKASAIITAMGAEKGSYLISALAKRRKIFKKGDPSKSVMGSP